MADLLFRFVKFALKSQYRKPKVYGMQNYDDSVPGIFLSNHERFFGPITVTTRFPVPVRQWAISVIVDTEEAKKYIKDIFNIVLGINRWSYRVIAYVFLMTDKYPPFKL